MKVKDIIDFASTGELATLSFVEDLESTDTVKKQKATKRILNYIYLGVLDLYTKFHFKTVIHSVITHSTISIYQPRINSSIALMDIYDAEGTPLAIPEYEGDEDWDVKQIDAGTFLLNNPEDDKEIFFVFSSTPDKLTDLEKEYDIPDVCLNALLFFIAMKGVSTFAPNMNQISFEQTDVFRKRYEYEIHKLRDIGVGNTGGRLARVNEEF